jgi:hypothetical protein
MRDYYARRAAYYERVYFKPERQPTCARWRPGCRRLCRPPRAGSGLRHRLVDTARRARCAHWLATDLNPETLAVARAKPLPACVELADGGRLQLADWAIAASTRLCRLLVEPRAAAAPGRLAGHPARAAGARRARGLAGQQLRADQQHAASRADDAGNTYQHRTLDDGSVHEVLKNFPTPEQAAALLGPRARHSQWTDYTHYWVLRYELA